MTYPKPIFEGLLIFIFWLGFGSSTRRSRAQKYTSRGKRCAFKTKGPKVEPNPTRRKSGKWDQLGSVHSTVLTDTSWHRDLTKQCGEKKEKQGNRLKAKEMEYTPNPRRWKKETNQAWDHFCGLRLMSSHAEEARPQLMGQIPEHYTKFRWRYSTIGFSISPGEEKTSPTMENYINVLDFLNVQWLKGH